MATVLQYYNISGDSCHLDLQYYGYSDVVLFTEIHINCHTKQAYLADESSEGEMYSRIQLYRIQLYPCFQLYIVEYNYISGIMDGHYVEAQFLACTFFCSNRRRFRTTQISAPAVKWVLCAFRHLTADSCSTFAYSTINGIKHTVYD